MSIKIKKILNYLNHQDNRLIPKIPKFFKISIIALLLISTFFIVKQQIVKAQSEAIYTGPIKDHPIKIQQDAIRKRNNLESWINESLAGNGTSALIALTGEIPDNVLSGEKTSWIPGGMMGQSINYLSYLYTPQASGVQYIADSFNSFIDKPVYAQGVGFKGLQPLLPLWKGFRNAIYIMISLVFVSIGLMVILRIKINPQTVITIQNSIPKLISSIILVTFSYAIAGLIIDFTYVISGLVVSALANSPGINSDLYLKNSFGDWARLFNRELLGISDADIAVTKATNSSLFQTIKLISRMANIRGIVAFNLIIGLVLVPFTSGASIALGFLGAIIFPLVLTIIIFIWIIKFLFGLAKCYFIVLLKIILAPLEIGLGAIPNMKMGFKSWIMSLIAHVSVFPITIIYIILVNLIINTIDKGSLWTPAVLSLGNIRDTAFFTKSIIGIASIALLPKLPKLIPEVIFKMEASPYGQAIGESFGGVTRTIGKGVTTGVKAIPGLLDDRALKKIKTAKDKKGTPPRWATIIDIINKAKGRK